MRFFRKTERDLPERYAIIVDEYMNGEAKYTLYYFGEDRFDIVNGQFLCKVTGEYGYVMGAHYVEHYSEVRHRHRNWVINKLVKDAKSDFNSRMGKVQKSRSTLSSLQPSEDAQNRSFIAP
jgi:hypothetical protein